MTVGQTAEIHVQSWGGRPPNSAMQMCGGSPSRPSDSVAIMHVQHSMPGGPTDGGSLKLYLKAQHPGHCSIRYSARG